MDVFTAFRMRLALHPLRQSTTDLHQCNLASTNLPLEVHSFSLISILVISSKLMVSPPYARYRGNGTAATLRGEKCDLIN